MKFILSIFIAFFSLSTYAEPLKLAVDGLTTSHKDLRLEVSTVYSNKISTQITTVPTQIQVDTNSFVSVPGIVSESTGNSDTLIGTISLRYGILPSTEIYTRSTGFTKQVRIEDSETGLSGTFNDTGFLESWIGVTHTLLPDAATPALLVFSEVAIFESNIIDSSSFDSWTFGVSTYRSIDPIVLMLSSSYGLYQERQDGDDLISPGDLLALNPSISFAVNDRITLLSGIQWLNKQKSLRNGAQEGQRSTSTSLDLGANISTSSNTTWSLTLTSALSGDDGANIRMRLSHYL